MSILQKHEFHFVMAESMVEELKSLDIYEESGNLSGVIVKILSLLAPALKAEHGWGHQRKSRYWYVSDNPDEQRKHIAVYLPEKVYRQLKLMHQDLNFYSIAQMIRLFLESFLGLVKEHGENVYKVLRREFKRWKKEDEMSRLTPREFLPQLCKILLHLPDHKGFITIYNDQNSPFRILRL